jgi:hypothetical protein
MRSAVMQLQLRFLELELLPAPPQITDEDIGEAKEIRDAAVEILARIIAQAAKTNEQTMGGV